MNENSALYLSEFIHEKLLEEIDCWSEEIDEKTELWWYDENRSWEIGSVCFIFFILFRFLTSITNHEHVYVPRKKSPV